MLILSIDSASSACSACVWQDGKILAEMTERMERGQDQRLMPLLLELMKKAGVAFDQLDRIAVTRGPGSFTGLRIGLAAARGIGLAANKPVIGIDRFSIFREQMKTAKDLLVVLESKRKELYCGIYHADKPIPETDMLTQEEINQLRNTKPDMAYIDDRQPPKESEAVTAAMLAAQADPNNERYLPRPLYIRAPDVTIKSQPVEQCA